MEIEIDQTNEHPCVWIGSEFLEDFVGVFAPTLCPDE
jgi:hypothetical protein